MIDKLILTFAIALLCVAVVSIFLAREIIRKKSSGNNEYVVVRNFKFVSFVVVVISLAAIYFCIK